MTRGFFWDDELFSAATPETPALMQDDDSVVSEFVEQTSGEVRFVGEGGGIAHHNFSAYRSRI